MRTMSREWVPMDREALLAELRTAFDDLVRESGIRLVFSYGKLV